MVEQLSLWRFLRLKLKLFFRTEGKKLQQNVVKLLRRLVVSRVFWRLVMWTALILFINDLSRHYRVRFQSPVAITRVTSPGRVGRQELHVSAMLSPLTGRSKPGALRGVPADVIDGYIRRYGKVAIAESRKYGIPASIKMAQALVESQAGTGRLAREFHNHFGIKCFSRTCKKGHCANFSDNSHKDFFRIYHSAWESWRAHSILLNAKRYRPLKAHGDDYKAWARGLQKLGYATDPHYAQKLIDVIETYQLYRLDQQT